MKLSWYQYGVHLKGQVNAGAILKENIYSCSYNVDIEVAYYVVSQFLERRQITTNMGHDKFAYSYCP